MKLELEAFSRWMREAIERGLFEAHWNEVGEDRETIALEPDFSKLLAMERAGALVSFSAREADGALAGYALMLASPPFLYKAHVFAYSIAIYIDPAHRGHGAVLVRLIERELRGRGVAKVFFIARAGTAFGKVLEELGYAASETAFAKLLA